MTRRPSTIYTSDTSCPRGHHRRFRSRDVCVSCHLLSQLQSDHAQRQPVWRAGLQGALDREGVEELALEIDRLCDRTNS